MKDIYRLKINDKFANIAPPLSAEEHRLLEESLLKDGCIDPIVVWNGTIVDGHNRYRICRQNKIPFEVKEMDFASEGDAMLWIIKNQLGRRNLSTFAKCKMVLPMEPQIKKEMEQHRRDAVSHYRRTGETVSHNVKSRDVLANLAGTSPRTLMKAKYIIASGDQETIRRLEAGELTIGGAYKTIKAEPSAERKNEWLLDLHEAVDVLTKKVSSGELSQKSMLAELNEISKMIENHGGC